MARRTTKQDLPDDFEEHILDIDIGDEMRTSFLEYSYSVIYSRALPDARDGLKPVQRRILYTMNDMGLRPDRGHVKSARVVGEVMGRLHPHGDGAIYDALVRLAQPWSMRVPMIDGHGNFGSPDDSPAAMRYTECRMAPAAVAMTAGIDEDTVDFRPNYDGRELEPSVLPAAIPNLVVNGSTGIAVGMATNMAPHNLVEVVQALRHLIKHPATNVDGLMRFIPGPDLPTGGKIVGLDGIRDAYETGRGIFQMRASARIETVGRRKGIVVTELPYGVGTERVIERIKTLVQGKKLQGIADVKDLTDLEKGLRLVIEVKNGFVPEALLEQLYRQTPMEDSFGINNVALVDGQPRTLGLKELLRGLPRAPLRRDPPAVGVPSGEGRRPAAPGRRPDRGDPRHRRGDPADPHLRRHRDGQGAPDAGLRPHRGADQLHPGDAAAPADPLLEDRAREGEVRARARDRGSRRHPGRRVLAPEGRVRRARRGGLHLRHPSADRAPGVGRQRRRDRLRLRAGGRRRPLPGPDVVVGTARADLAPDADVGAGGARANHDVVVSAIATTARGDVGVLTSAGRVIRLGVLDLPTIPASANDPNLQGGLPISEVLPLASGERALALCRLSADGPGLALGTKQGTVKRVNPEVLSNRDDWEVIGLKDGDEVVGALELTTGTETLCFITSDAQLLHFGADGVRPQGRSGGGIAGVKLAAGQHVAWFGAIDPAAPEGTVVVTASGSSTALPGTEPGAVKVTPFAEYPAKGRATGGVRCHRFLKGEDTLVFAWAGTAPARAAATGSPVDLPEAIGRRDGSGLPGSQPIAACAGPVASRVPAACSRRCGRLTACDSLPWPRPACSASSALPSPGAATTRSRSATARTPTR